MTGSNMLGFGDDDDVEETVEELEKKEKKLKKKAQVEKLKKQVGSQGESVRGKIDRVLRDFSKRGAPGEKSALSILVGPSEGGKSTEGFVLGETDDVHSSVSEFITGKDHEVEGSEPFSFDEVIGGGDGVEVDGGEWFKNGIV